MTKLGDRITNKLSLNVIRYPMVTLPLRLVLIVAAVFTLNLWYVGLDLNPPKADPYLEGRADQAQLMRTAYEHRRPVTVCTNSATGLDITANLNGCVP